VHLKTGGNALAYVLVEHKGSSERGARLRAFLKALKYSRRRDLPQRIGILLAEAPLLEETDLVLILRYSGQGADRREQHTGARGVRPFRA
jgi:hypothetical protein